MKFNYYEAQKKLKAGKLNFSNHGQGLGSTLVRQWTCENGETKGYNMAMDGCIF